MKVLAFVLAGLAQGVFAQFGGPVCANAGDAPYADCEEAIAQLQAKLPERTTTCNTTVPIRAHKFASYGNCTIISYDQQGGTAHCRSISHVIQGAQEVVDWCVYSDDYLRGAVTWRDLRLMTPGRNYNGNVTVGFL